MLRPPGGIAKSSGSTIRTRSGSSVTEAELSIVSATVLNATQPPAKRDIAQPYSPRSRMSSIPAGFSTGIAASMKAYSDWCARVEDLQVWSSPAIASTPPYRAEPAELPCFKASPARSTPGPLPYQIANTPSYLAPGNRPICWLPHTAVAPSSSLIAGWKWMWLRSMKRRAAHSA